MPGATTEEAKVEHTADQPAVTVLLDGDTFTQLDADAVQSRSEPEFSLNAHVVAHSVPPGGYPPDGLQPTVAGVYVEHDYARALAGPHPDFAPGLRENISVIRSGSELASLKPLRVMGCFPGVSQTASLEQVQVPWLSTG
jgi:hypothetical protein